MTWSGKVFEASPGRSSRIRHRNALTERTWKDAVQGLGKCLSGNKLSYSELFDDTSLMLNERRLCVIVDSLISAAKVFDCVISAWC